MSNPSRSVRRTKKSDVKVEEVAAAVSAPTSVSESSYSPKNVCVVYETDGNSTDQCRIAWSCRSLVKHSNIKFDVAVLSNEPTIPLDSLVPGIAEHGKYINVLDMYDTLASVGMSNAYWNRAWPYELLYRMGLPLHPAFSEYDRILTLDTDTLVFSDRVDTFIRSDVGNYELGAVVDVVQEENDRIRTLVGSEMKPEYAERMISYFGDSIFTRPYVNAGVLLWNLPEIRKDIDWYKERIAMFWEAELRGLFHFLDQDFINSLMRIKADYSLVYNWFNICNRDTSGCVIQHYCGHQYDRMTRRAAEDGLL